MAIAPGYEHDVFVSYAHIDNEDSWVSEFVKRLRPALSQRLGVAEAVKIFVDDEATGPNSHLVELLTAVEHSALFLAIGSPSYAAHEWPLHELDAFTRGAPDLARLFMVEYLPLRELGRYPAPLDTKIRLEFWKAGTRRHTPVPLSPVDDGELFRELISSLAASICDQIWSLRLLARTKPPADLVADRQSADAAAGREDFQLGRPRKTILLAQTTDDVEDEADQLRRYLRQYEEEITILPSSGYPQGGEAFKAAFARDLARADAFVQLLGRRIGRIPPDLPSGYSRYQFDAAKSVGVQILQWRHPDLDVGSVRDVVYQHMLTSDTVVASGFEAFKRQILELARKPRPTPRFTRSSTVFINADEKDLMVAKEIERDCLRSAFTTILPMSEASPEATRKDLAENLIDCDVLVFIYGDTTQDWIRSQLKFFNKVRPKRESEPKLLAICSGPPPKPDIGISLPNARVICSADTWNLDALRALISEVDA